MLKKRTKSKKSLLEQKREIYKICQQLPPKIYKILLKELKKYPNETSQCLKIANNLLFRSSKRRITSVSVGIKNVDELINKIVKSPKDFLLLLSYCSKPLRCRSKRFSKKCQSTNNPICNNCPLKEIISKAKKIGCKYFIVTHDDLMFTQYLLPRFQNFRKSKKYQPLIATGCSLMVNKYYKSAIILGSVGIGYKFINGSCKNLKDYQKAEEGEKTKVTKLSRKDWQEINYILDEVIKKIDH